MLITIIITVSIWGSLAPFLIYESTLLTKKHRLTTQLKNFSGLTEIDHYSSTDTYIGWKYYNWFILQTISIYFNLHAGFEIMYGNKDKWYWLAQIICVMRLKYNILGNLFLKFTFGAQNLGIYFDEFLFFKDHISDQCIYSHIFLPNFSNIRNHFSSINIQIHAFVTNKLGHYSL